MKFGEEMNIRIYRNQDTYSVYIDGELAYSEMFDDDLERLSLRDIIIATELEKAPIEISCDKRLIAKDGWDWPIEELGYLCEEHAGETFVLVGDRLYETEG